MSSFSDSVQNESFEGKTNQIEERISDFSVSPPTASVNNNQRK